MKIDETIQRSADAHGHGHAHAEGEPDAWHAHTADEGRPMDAHTQSVDITVLLKWLVGLLIALVVVILAVVKFFEVTRLEYLQTQVETSVLAEEYAKKREGLDAELSTGGKERRFSALPGNKVQIPIDDAMQKVVAGYASGTKSLPAMHKGQADAPPAAPSETK